MQYGHLLQFHLLYSPEIITFALSAIFSIRHCFMTEHFLYKHFTTVLVHFTTVLVHFTTVLVHFTTVLVHFIIVLVHLFYSTFALCANTPLHGSINIFMTFFLHTFSLTPNPYSIKYKKGQAFSKSF